MYKFGHISTKKLNVKQKKNCSQKRFLLRIQDHLFKYKKKIRNFLTFCKIVNYL